MIKYHLIKKENIEYIMSSIILYSKKNCKRCDEIKILLKQLDVNFKIVMVNGLQNVYDVLEKSDLNHNDEEYIFTSFPILIDLDKKITMDYSTILSTYKEPLLIKNCDVDTIFPIQYPDMWESYEKAVASFWTSKEIDFSRDEQDWNKLNDNEQHFIKNILAFFAGADGIVNTNLINNFSDEVQIPEARAFYSYQQFNETIHSETYSLLIERYVKDKNEKMHLLRGIHTINSIKKKAEWCKKYINREYCPSFAKRLIAFACVEGILFSGAFCSIYWLKKRGLLPGLCFSNELISKDEGSHLEFACLLFSKLNFKPSQLEVYEIIKEAIDHEKEFIIESLPCNLIGMNSKLMTEYICYVGDRLLTMLGYKKFWFAENPFDFMESISVQGKSNFFEKRVSEYNKCNVLSNENNTFSLDAEF